MTPQHTPAPWHNGWGKIVDSEGKAICMVTYRKNGYNDLLLAAAPDLLAALQNCVNVLSLAFLLYPEESLEVELLP